MLRLREWKHWFSFYWLQWIFALQIQAAKLSQVCWHFALKSATRISCVWCQYLKVCRCKVINITYICIGAEIYFVIYRNYWVFLQFSKHQDYPVDEWFTPGLRSRMLMDIHVPKGDNYICSSHVSQTVHCCCGSAMFMHSWYMSCITYKSIKLTEQHTSIWRGYINIWSLGWGPLVEGGD